MKKIPGGVRELLMVGGLLGSIGALGVMVKLFAMCLGYEVRW